MGLGPARGQTLWKTERPVLNVAMAFSPDERWLAAGWHEGGISLIDLSTGREAKRLPSEAPVGVITFHPDGTRYTTWTPDNRAFVCRTEDGGTLRVFSGEARWHPGGKLLAVACPDSRIRVYDTDSWQAPRCWRGNHGPNKSRLATAMTFWPPRVATTSCGCGTRWTATLCSPCQEWRSPECWNSAPVTGS